MPSNWDLAAYAQKALAQKWGYVLGTFGQILTESLLKQKMSQGGGVGEYNSKWQSYERTLIGTRVSDCYGLVKGCLWTDDKGNVVYNVSQDRNQEMAYSVAREKGTLATMPDLPGVVLWMKGHAGIYVGNGQFIECVGCPVGTRAGTIKNGVVTSGSKFTHWFKDNYFTYTTSKPRTDVEWAVEVLVKNGVISSPDYWLEHYGDVKYLDQLIINMAEKLSAK